jgi:hypothetical protein
VVIETNKKLLIVPLMIVIFAAGVFAAPLVRHGEIHWSADVYVEENVGGVTSQLAAGNVITDIGEEYIRTVLSTGATRNGTDDITVSNDASPVQTWTKLANEATTAGCGRVSGNVTEWAATDDGYNVTARFDISGAITVQCAGLHWSPTAGTDNNMFACAAFTQTTFASGDYLTITWVITSNAN